MRVNSVQSKLPEARWLFANFTIIDVWPGSLRETAKILNRSWQALTGKLRGILGSFRVTEINPSQAHAEMDNAHIHGLVALSRTAHSGRSYWSCSDWRQAWISEVGVLARATEDSGVKVQAVEDMDRVTNYIVPWGVAGKKGFLAKAEEAIANPGRYVERIHQLRGLPRYLYSGLLDEKRPDPKQDLTGLDELTGTPSKFRTLQRQLGRELNSKAKTPYKPIPIADEEN